MGVSGSDTQPSPSGAEPLLAGASLPSARVTSDTGCVASANLDIVRSIAASWERGCYSSVEWADPEIEFVIADGPEPGRWRGPTALAPKLLDFQNAWQEYHSEAVEYRELDDERVLVLTYASGRAKASGIQLGQTRANLFHVRDGKVTRLVAYWDRERALADLGLANQGDPPAS
jgi:ketosteroid isomerase-like protein